MAQTTIGLAKVTKDVSSVAKKSYYVGSAHRVLNNLLVGNKENIFNGLARALIPILEDFDARHLSNLIYAFGLAKQVLQFEDGSNVFVCLQIMPCPN